MEKGYHKGQELTMANLGLSLEELNGQPLELLAREGARLVLSECVSLGGRNASDTSVIKAVAVAIVMVTVIGK